MHGKVQGTGAERDNGARGRCTGAREGAGRGLGDGVPGQSAITVHRRAREGEGTGAERDNGARVHGEVQEGDRGRAR